MIIKRNNLLDKIDIDFSGEFNHEKWGCVEDGVCRCYKIKKINKVSLNIEDISRYFYSLFKSEESYGRSIKIMKIISELDEHQIETINYWGLENILRINKIWELEKWDIKIKNLYYGEEIESAYLKHEVLDKINEDFKSFDLCRDLKSKTNFLFEKTRGYYGKYEILNVNISDIYGFDPNFISPMSVCHIEEGCKWKVIEGIKSTKKHNHKKIYIIGIS
jgi:hypothetical protein